MNNKKIISVIGGSGFIGSYLVDKLLSQGYFVKIISRNATSKKQFFPSAKLGQFQLVNCNICKSGELKKALFGSEYVINLVGILESRADNSFNDVHIKGAKNLVEACSFNDISKLIQVSAIGVEQNKLSKYAITKFKAEKIIQSYKNSLIVRPSIVCGDEDNFINFFAKYAKLSPFLPLIGKGETKFQPVLVTDVVEIISRCLNFPFKKGQIIEIGGDDILSFKEILSFIVKELRIKRMLVNVPFSLASKLAFFLEKFPFSILTRDQVEMLKTDNIMNKRKSFKKFFKYEPLSFYIFAKRQLENFKKDGGHIN
jgi:uncharacterized protein YbjT (DUF2867 family)